MNILAMILAGGTGEELSVLTRHRAKTALPFGGRYRIIDFCLSNCTHSGIHNIAILAQYSPKSLIEHIRMGKPWDLDRKTGGIFIHQPTHDGRMAQWYLGTADALYQNIEVIRGSNANLILVLSGDQVYVMDYRRMVDFHLEHGKPVTIAVKEVKPSQRSRFGMVQCSKSGLISAFREKPVSSNFRFASLGIYLFDRELLLGMLGSDTIDIVFDIIMPLLADREVAGYRHEGYWEDIGSIQSYYSASRRLLRQRSIITNPQWPICTRDPDLPPAKFSRSCSVGNSIVTDGCRISGTVKGSILFPGVSVERRAVVEDSIVFPFSRISEGALLKKSIVDKEVYIGPATHVGVTAKPSPDAIPAALASSSAIALADMPVIGKGVRISRGSDIPRGVIIEPYSRISTRDRA